MLPENFEIQPFDMKNIPLMLEVVLPMWSPQKWDMAFRRFYVEHIIRSNYFENEYHYARPKIGSILRSKNSRRTCSAQQNWEKPTSN